MCEHNESTDFSDREIFFESLRILYNGYLSFFGRSIKFVSKSLIWIFIFCTPSFLLMTFYFNYAGDFDYSIEILKVSLLVSAIFFVIFGMSLITVSVDARKSLQRKAENKARGGDLSESKDSKSGAITKIN